MFNSKMYPIRKYHNEEFKEVEFEHKLKLRYAVSNKGRLISFENDINFGRELKGSRCDGYRVFKYKLYNKGKITNKQVFISKIVAKYFLQKDSEDQTYVLHLDRVRDNDDCQNLKWATREQMLEFTLKSPFVLEARKNFLENNKNSKVRKLTVTKVILIKKMLARPERKTRMKMIAKQFGVSEMQIYRIKSGENWGHVKI